MNPGEIVSRAIARSAHVQRIDMSMQETIDALWQIAQDVAMENGTQYVAIRNAIAWLEVLRNA